MKQCLLIFLKYPEPGLVKTRLAADLGDRAAANLARAMAEDLLEAVRWLGDADRIVCFSPRERAGEMAAWLGPGESLLPQRGRDLGLRMKNALAEAFRRGYDRALLVGGDVPGVDDDLLREAFAGLEGDAVAVGPSEDGGYWMIGCTERGFAPECFTDVDWGTDRVLDQTLKWLEFSQKTIVRAPVLRDVDTLADLRALLAAGRLRPHSRTLALARELLGS